MPDIKTTLKEAIAKASSEETEIADRLAHAVLQREHDGAMRASTWADQVAQQETALLAKQRTVDALKLALSRLPEAVQTY
jgi:siroheme synthase (precorrin-2 oxidase/ferrochelatase)